MRFLDALFAGGTLALAALPIGMFWGMAWPAAAAAFVVGTLLWLLCWSWPLNRRRGALVGALTGVLAHPLCWFFASLSLPVTAPQPLRWGTVAEGFWSCILLSWVSLSLVGWLTATVGAIAGAIVGWALGRWP